MVEKVVGRMRADAGGVSAEHAGRASGEVQEHHMPQEGFQKKLSQIQADGKKRQHRAGVRSRKTSPIKLSYRTWT